MKINFNFNLEKEMAGTCVINGEVELSVDEIKAFSMASKEAREWLSASGKRDLPELFANMAKSIHDLKKATEE